MWLLLIVCFFLVLCLLVFKRKHNYWEKREVPGPKPILFFGNIGSSLIGLRNVGEIYADIYNKYQDCPFVGVYRMGHPCLLIRDPELIKNVLIKDFNHFTDNDFFVDKNLDPLISRNPFALKGEEWKRERQFVTPNFASGKIKAVVPLVENVGKNLVTYLEKQEGLVLNAKDVFVKYTCDVVAVCGLGIDGNSFEDPNAVFISLISKFSMPDSWQGIKFALSILLPNYINIQLLPQSFNDGVIALTTETLKYRRENNIRRNDFFDAISASPTATPIQIAAHLANLILDGFETSSTVMTFVLYELSANPECQVKVRNEINNVLKNNNGNFTYEAMQDMVYLDACVKETLRLHPILAQLSKLCTSEKYTMTSTNPEFKNMSVTLDKDSSILIPLLGLHRDPKYFPSPDKFIPERFLDKGDSFKNVYMPFGSGPRMCLGTRFAFMQIKIAFIQMIRNFEITLSEKTKQPLQYDPFYFSLYPKGGAWFKCKKIDFSE